MIHTIETIKRSWNLTVDIRPFLLQKGYTSILQIIRNGSLGRTANDRCVGIWFQNLSNQLRVEFNGFFSGTFHDTSPIPMEKISRIQINMIEVSAQLFSLKIFVNDVLEHTIGNIQQIEHHNMAIYLSNPFEEAGGCTVNNVMFRNGLSV